MRSVDAIACFDVFDTVLTRVVGAPVSVFLLLGRLLQNRNLLTCTPQQFASERIAAESRARWHFEHGEVTLRDIYRQLAHALHLDDTCAADIQELECNFERQLVRVVPAAASLISSERSLGKQIVFASDMYLPQKTIVDMLRDAGVWQDEDTCLVSGELAMNKRNGQLFKHLLSSHEISTQHVVHFGNCDIADVRSPQRLGIRVRPLTEANPNRYEQLLERYARDTSGYSSILAGTSRLARLHVECDTERDKCIRDVAAGVVAPTLVVFVLWILREAKRRKIDKLFFVSRDGEVLLEIARCFAEQVGFAGELRYLYGGRQAWHLPALSISTQGCEAWLFEMDSDACLLSRLGLAGLSLADHAEELSRVGLPTSAPNRRLNKREEELYRSWLTQPHVWQQVLIRAEKERQCITRYFKQEGLLGTGRCAIVDIGWRGRIQVSLERLLTAAGGTLTAGLYFGLYMRSAELNPATSPCFFFDVPLSLGGYQNKLAPLPEAIEMFCAGTHGPVQGFREDEGVVLPRLKYIQNDAAIKWGLHLMRQTILTFARSLPRDIVDLQELVACRTPIASVLKEFLSHPTSCEAKTWGSFPFEQGQVATFARTFANAYAFGDARICYSHCRIQGRQPGFWVAGSVALSSTPIVWLLRASALLGRVRRKAFKILREYRLSASKPPAAQ